MQLSRILALVALFAASGLAQLAVFHDLPTTPPPLQDYDRGAAVAMIGDVDFDGHADFCVSEPGYVFDLGRVQMISGANGAILWSVVGENTGDRFGHAVARAGRTDTEGAPDVVVGAPFYGGGLGRVYILSGSTGALRVLRTGGQVENLGFSVAGIGDYNDNGWEDVVLGAPKRLNIGNPDAGGFYVIDGGTNQLMILRTNNVAGEQYGYAVGGTRDFNGDDKPDFIVASPFANGDDGYVEVWGRPYGTDVMLASVTGPQAGAGSGSRFGFSVDGAGDTNLDGLSDIIVGSPGELSAPFAVGGARILRGPLGLVSRTFSGGILSSAGSSVAGVGDINGDGFPDVAVGRPGAGLTLTSPGSVYLYSGFDGSILATKGGVLANGTYGSAVDGGADINADGLNDVVVGAKEDDRVQALGFPLTYPGSLESLWLQASVNNERLARFPDVNPAAPGDFLRIRLVSPTGAYTYTVPVLLAQVFATGASPGSVPGLPELHFTVSNIVVLFDGSTAGIVGQVLLPPNGILFAYPVPLGLAGQSLIIQGACLAPSANTGNPFAASEGQVFEF